MPKINESEKDALENRKFINEKIVPGKPNHRLIVRRFGFLLLAAALFGAVSAVSFVGCKALMEGILRREGSSPVTIPKDEPESMEVESSLPEVQTSEPIEDILQSAIEQYEFDMDDLNILLGNMSKVCQESSKGIVSVHSVKTQTDWFDNSVENMGLFAGAIVGSTETEVLILTPVAAVESADSIEVAFYDGVTVSGRIKQTDSVFGLSIVGVNRLDVEASTLKNIKVMELGNSYSVRQGDLVAAIGGPAGVVHSIDYGFISYINRNVHAPDSSIRIFYSDIASDAASGTFLINTSGQIVGVVMDAYKIEGHETMTAAIAISDYKGMLEKLMNGEKIPYFGVRGQEVTDAMADSGMPRGVYISEALSGSPIYNAGIQRGDMIVRINGKSILTFKDLQHQVELLKPEQVVSVVVARNGRDEYKELEYQVTIGAR